ncbi:lathosterol oxidase-like [Macrosteles quadrilineatus]|uniref:lathosterol oxidase-like n=1 Tax=Macrosteles quadrilineatus TaxID=74068 RepID=UPI0023E28D01|nr:lathosterol oxidase-like [Macrosteles quadrilineatus]
MMRLCLEWYYNFLEKHWKKLPSSVKPCIVSLAVFLLGITIKGEWILLFVHLLKQYGYQAPALAKDKSELPWEGWTLEYFRLQGLPLAWVTSNLAGFAIWFSVGGFLQWYYYRTQHDQPEQWKCQPDRWLSQEQEREEFLWGCAGLLTTSTGSAVIATLIRNGSYSTIYYRLDTYPLIWYFLQWPVCFVLQDYFTYWAHRIYHTPFLYKRFHKIHHRYKAPTCWSVTAFHPFEIFTMQMVLASPLYFLPVHWTSFTAVGIYTYYNAILDHSGVDIKAPKWQFWKPDSIFHDNHHQYTHVNYGFNCYYWDLIHGTYRKTDRIYNENIFYGYGKSLSDATKDELETEANERLAENIKAHRRLTNVLLKE